MIEWLPWGADAFARAARERKPVLLSITAAWCAACHEMDRATYADPAVSAVVADRFVPVRVDTDRRPDINERYNLGGWPTTAFLTPEGEVLTGGTFIPVDRMCAVLDRVAVAYDAIAARDGASDMGRRGHSHAANIPSVENDLDERSLIDSIFSAFDEAHGGFGVEPKFPHAAPLALAMALYRETGDPRWREIVERTLDAMFDGGLWDAERGGFYRYAVTRDWQLPHREKLLETNAALLAVYAEAGALFQRATDADRCSAIARFITGTLRAESGGYYGSDSDRILYVDANAAAASGLLAAATALGDSALGQEALASFERVLLVCYKPGHGLAHYFDGAARVRGLLADQAAAMHALLDAHEISGGEPYRMMAEELAHLVVRDMRDAAHGGFFDRVAAPDDIGLLRAPRTLFLENAEGARALARIAQLEPRKGFPDPAVFAEHAAGALRAAGSLIGGQGPRAAHYVLAERQLKGSAAIIRTRE